MLIRSTAPFAENSSDGCDWLSLPEVLIGDENSAIATRLHHNSLGKDPKVIMKLCDALSLFNAVFIMTTGDLPGSFDAHRRELAESFIM